MQNGLRHSSVVRMEKERGGVEASKGIGVRGERGSSIQRSLSTHLCEAVCANLTSPASPPAPSLPLSLSLSLSQRCDALYVGYDDSGRGNTRSVNPLAVYVYLVQACENSRVHDAKASLGQLCLYINGTQDKKVHTYIHRYFPFLLSFLSFSVLRCPSFYFKRRSVVIFFSKGHRRFSTNENLVLEFRNNNKVGGKWRPEKGWKSLISIGSRFSKIGGIFSRFFFFLSNHA